MDRAEAMMAAEVEYVTAEMDLDVWVDAVRWGRRTTSMSRLEVVLNTVGLMARKGIIPRVGTAFGLMAVALDRLADAKDAAGAPLSTPEGN